MEDFKIALYSNIWEQEVVLLQSSDYGEIIKQFVAYKGILEILQEKEYKILSIYKDNTKIYQESNDYITQKNKEVFYGKERLCSK